MKTTNTILNPIIKSILIDLGSKYGRKSYSSSMRLNNGKITLHFYIHKVAKTGRISCNLDYYRNQIDTANKEFNDYMFNINSQGFIMDMNGEVVHEQIQDVSYIEDASYDYIYNIVSNFFTNHKDVIDNVLNIKTLDEYLQYLRKMHGKTPLLQGIFAGIIKKKYDEVVSIISLANNNESASSDGEDSRYHINKLDIIRKYVLFLKKSD